MHPHVPDSSVWMQAKAAKLRACKQRRQSCGCASSPWRLVLLCALGSAGGGGSGEHLLYENGRRIPVPLSRPYTGQDRPDLLPPGILHQQAYSSGTVHNPARQASHNTPADIKCSKTSEASSFPRTNKPEVEQNQNQNQKGGVRKKEIWMLAAVARVPGFKQSGTMPSTRIRTGNNTVLFPAGTLSESPQAAHSPVAIS